MRKILNQLSISHVYKNCKYLFDNDKPKFITLLEQTIDFADFIPPSFYNAFYKQFCRKRNYTLESFISKLFLQKIYSIPTDTLLFIFLNSSKILRAFCGFSKVPVASKFIHFKQNFIVHLTQMFNKLVDYTKPICQAINSNLSSTLFYDSSGIKTYVSENHPKYINTLIHTLRHLL